MNRQPSGVHLSVDGVVVPAEECVWVELAPCGCLAGVMNVQSYFTLEAAASEFHDSADPAWVKRSREQGFVMKLMTFEAYKLIPTVGCDHDPKWGIPPRPTIDGYSWKVERGAGAKKTARLHIFSDNGTTSLCGRVDDAYGMYKAEWIGGHLECTECWKRAEVAATGELPAAEGVLI